MNRSELIAKAMNEVHGKFIPKFYWGNHEPMRYWYDDETDSIIVDCGYSSKITLSNSEINRRNLVRFIKDVQIEVIEFFKAKGKDLYTPQD